MMARADPSRLNMFLRDFPAAGLVSLPGNRSFLIRDLIFEKKFLKKSNHGGGDQENEPKSFERIPSTAFNKALMSFTVTSR